MIVTNKALEALKSVYLSNRLEKSESHKRNEIIYNPCGLSRRHLTVSKFNRIKEDLFSLTKKQKRWWNPDNKK